jgi:uracil-DNA glycosylase family 4
VKTTVPSDGPLSARLLWVGEAPGHTEVAEGKPFVGASGQIVRSTLRWAGFDVEHDVRFTNAVRHNPGQFPADKRGSELLLEYAAELDAEISSMPQLRVVVACGGPAATRLTGRRSGSGWDIGNNRGYVFHNAHLPTAMRWHPSSDPWITRMPEGVVVVPTFHPAGIMRSKGRDDIALLRRDVHKAKLAVDKRLKRPNISIVLNPDPRAVEKAACDAQRMYFDTEFGENHQIFLFGVTFDGHEIFEMPWEPKYMEVIRTICEAPSVKGAHNIIADAEALWASGEIELSGEWYDTMLGMHALHPALEVGLDDTARYYIDDIQPWKDMDHKDPRYNALDVAYGWACWDAQVHEAAQRPVDPTPEIVARMHLIPVTYAMTTQGLLVDEAKRKTLIETVVRDIAQLNTRIDEAVKPFWDKRVRAAMEEVRDAETEYQELRSADRGACDKHPSFNGLRAPAKTCPTCQAIHNRTVDKRSAYARSKRRRARSKTDLARWEGGFNPANNEHLRWLLYDPYAFRLPVQRLPGSRRPTANRLAIDRLAMLRTVQRNKNFSTVTLIKDVQHLAKANSTFLSVPTDSNNYAHPPYKIHGTRTGRLAGGRDDDEKSDNRYAYNALNIPKEWRVMYVAPPGHCFVAADWRNVEGRLTSYFCRDPGYQRALDGELSGGFKVHAINAGIIYNIDPADSKSHMVELSGQRRPAYDAGKRLTHAWSYGMQARKMSATFNITIEEAVEIDVKLSTAYPRLVEWRTQLVTDVLGLWDRMTYDKPVCAKEGRRFLANPFGWQMFWWGIDAVQANEVIAFLPQSTGAGMWTRCAPILHARYPVVQGTYDSFVLLVRRDATEVREAREFLVKVMERTWDEIGGLSFPCEVSVGFNLGEYDEEKNTYGLKEVA